MSWCYDRVVMEVILPLEETRVNNDDNNDLKSESEDDMKGR